MKIKRTDEKSKVTLTLGQLKRLVSESAVDMQLAISLSRTESILADILEYCRNSIDDFGHMERKALDEIDHSRCSLHHASPELYDRMVDAIDEYCMDNGIENEFDPEDVFWAND